MLRPPWPHLLALAWCMSEASQGSQGRRRGEEERWYLKDSTESSGSKKESLRILGDIQVTEGPALPRSHHWNDRRADWH